MACIVKRPIGDSKGVLVVTDGEYRDLLRNSPVLQERFAGLRSRWLLLVHGNSAIRQTYAHDSKVDAFIAGPGDIASADATPLPQIEMDCSNFSPDFFATAPGTQKFWDVLFISRNQPFKSLDKLFDILRIAFNESPLRVLAIIAHTDAADLKSSEPLQLYVEKFSAAERKLFTLLTPFVDYPFSFDLQTLAHFYHQSRVFLHTAAEERHPRVVGYAWAAGLPVIAPESAAALLPRGMAAPPGFFAFDNTIAAAAQLRRALSAAALPSAYSQFHLTSFQTGRLKDEIRALYSRLGGSFADGGWELADLDIRLARHHDIRAGTNSYGASLYQFTRLLEKPLPSTSASRIEEALDGAALQEPDDASVLPAKPAGSLRHKMRHILGHGR